MLNRCLNGLTQNQNEAINGALWSICPKTRFCERKTIESVICEAINKFNTGSKSTAELITSFNISPGNNMLHQLEKEITRRIKADARKIVGKARVQRQKLRSSKKKNIDSTNYIPR